MVSETAVFDECSAKVWSKKLREILIKSILKFLGPGSKSAPAETDFAQTIRDNEKR